jgi:hypothetical protein
MSAPVSRPLNIGMLVIVSAFLLILISTSHAAAEGVVYRGVFRNIPLTESCKGQAAKEEVVLILDAPPSKATTGVFYCTESSPGKLRRTAPGVFEIITPVDETLKLKPSTLHVTGKGKRLHVTINQCPPDDPALQEEYCWSKAPAFPVRLTRDNPEQQKKRALALYDQESELLKGRRLLYDEDNYEAALVVGRKLLASMEHLHGANSKTALLAVDLVLVSLIEKERYDEALQVVEPFCRAFPDHEDLREFEQIIREKKAEQDKLFRYDLDNDDGTELEPFA